MEDLEVLRQEVTRPRAEVEFNKTPLKVFLQKNPQMSLEKYDIKIAKGTTDPRVEKKTFLGHITSSRTINFHLQNLDQASTSKSQPNISISDKLKIQNETKPSFKISTKIQLHNLYKTSAAKY